MNDEIIVNCPVCGYRRAGNLKRSFPEKWKCGSCRFIIWLALMFKDDERFLWHDTEGRILKTSKLFQESLLI